MTNIKVIKKSGTSTVKLTDIIVKQVYLTNIVSENLKRIIKNSFGNMAHTKTRGEIRGGGRKPWKQKGTGRARAGSIRSPLFKGGGVTFGPRTSKRISKTNSKSIKNAIYSVLKKNEKNIYILDINLTKPSTKIVNELLSNNIKFSNLLIIGNGDKMINLSTKNLPNTKYVDILSLNVYNVSIADKIVFTQKAYNNYFGIIDKPAVKTAKKDKI